MDTALKHRITGAVILVGLAVLLLPELFQGAGRPPAAGLALEEDTATLREVEIDLREGSAVPLESTIAFSEPPVSEPVAPAVVPAPAAAPPPTPATTPAPAPATTPAPATPPAPAAPTPAPATTPAVASPGFFVQVGVFSNRQGADAVARTLRDQGFEVRVTRAESAQPLHRVWVGPARDRAAAEALLRRVRAAGHSGLVVSP